MLAFFTDPYEDELLYSALARYHYYMGDISCKQTLVELFNKFTKLPAIGLPSDLNILSGNLNNKLYNAQYLIDQHTIMPYYKPFLFKNRYEKIERIMNIGRGGDIYSTIGISAGGLFQGNVLRYCPTCIEQDKKQYGEAYFHRAHHLDGILVCHKHGTMLNQYTELPARYKTKYIRLNDACIDKYVEENTRYNDQLLWLADAAYYLLSSSLDINYEQVHQKYLKQLREKGYVSWKGMIDQKQFYNDFTRYYSDYFLNMLHSRIEYSNEYNWLKVITRNSKRCSHPLRNLLLINFLFGDIKAFFEKESSNYMPFGSGPWPCLNKVADHYEEMVIDKVKLTVDHKRKVPVGTFECGCGFIYARSGPDNCSEDINKYGRIKSFGHVWEEKLKLMLAYNSLSLREMARRMHCDVNTIKKFSEKFKLQNEISLLEIQNITEKCENKEELSVRGISTIKDTRVDWMKRDEELLDNIKNAYKDLLLLDKPVRITRSQIGKQLKINSLLDQKLDKLPNTKACLDEIVETPNMFRCRRIDGVINKGLKVGRVYKAWEIERLAGIRSEYYSELVNYIERRRSEYYH